MYHLATLAPPVQRIKIPLSRDQVMLLMAAINEIFLGVDIYLAHSISGTIVPYEWIPIIFGPVAGVVLLVAGLIAIKQRETATVLATLVLLGSIIVGVLGAYFHLDRAALPAGPEGESLTVRLLVWGPPVLGPLMFAMTGLLGISAAWVEDPPDSGRLRLLFGRKLRLPLPKTRAYFLIVALGSLATVLSAVLDHARTGYENPWLWVPTVVGVFATVVAATMGAIERPTRSDLWTYTVAMLLTIATGLIGAVLHVDDNLTSRGAFVAERFIRGAPFMAPLLFANLGSLGLFVLLDPRSETLRELVLTAGASPGLSGLGKRSLWSKVMRLLVLVTGEYGWRHVDNIRRHAPPGWEVATWQTPKVLPPVLDYPEDYLPESLPPSDLILSLAEVKGVAEMIPEIAQMTGAQAVIAPIDSVAWLPVGLARQLCEWLARIDVACVTPKPFCSLTATHTNALRQRVPYQAHPLIAAFAAHFGQPAFRATVDEDTRQIVALDVERDACCGCARYVAERLSGTPVDDAIEAGGLHHHHYPCQASMGIDPQYGDTLMHVSGNIMKDALHDALEPYLQKRYVRPTGYVDAEDGA